MSLYPIHYFDDKDYDMPEIAIFHAHYPHINVQYAEISFHILGNHGMQGAEFQIIDCTSNYLLFTLSVIWRQCFGGAALERAEAALNKVNKMTMSKERFDELKLKDLEVECSYCKVKFPLSCEDTIGGGYGVIGIKCAACKQTFAIEGGAG